MSAKIFMEPTNNYISQLRNHMTAASAKPSYFSHLRNGSMPEEPAEEKDSEEAPVEEIKKPSAEEEAYEKDIQEAKKEGFTLEDVLNGIDEMEEIKNKDLAKEVAKKVYAHES